MWGAGGVGAVGREDTCEVRERLSKVGVRECVTRDRGLPCGVDGQWEVVGETRT